MKFAPFLNKIFFCKKRNPTASFRNCRVSVLNIREESNGEIKLDNGEMWVQISDKQFVNVEFLKTE